MSAIQQVLSAYGLVPPDPNYSLRALGLHCDGANGGTTFTDNSPTPKTVTPTIVTTSTAQAKFGTSALFAVGNVTEKLSIPHSSDLAPTGDFAIFMWVYLTATSGSTTRVLIWKSVSTGHTPYGVRLTAAASPKIQCFASNTAGSAFAINMTGTITITTGSWHYIEYSRTGSAYRLFVNGVQDVSASNAAAGYVNAAHSVFIGNVSDSISPLGSEGSAYLDDILVYNGTAGNTANYTPPASPFADS